MKNIKLSSLFLITFSFFVYGCSPKLPEDINESSQSFNQQIGNTQQSAPQPTETNIQETGQEMKKQNVPEIMENAEQNRVAPQTEQGNTAM